MTGWLLPLALACGSATAPAPDVVQGPPVQEAVLHVGAGQGLRVEMAGAWIDDRGDGHGQQVEATAAGDPPLTVSSLASSWDLRDGTMVFEGQVVAARGPVTLTADRLEVTYAGERVQRAVATGSVRVVRGEQEARADRAVLTPADGRVVMEGRPELRLGDRRLTAVQLVLSLDDEKVQCDTCRLEVDGEAVRALHPSPRPR